VASTCTRSATSSSISDRPNKTPRASAFHRGTRTGRSRDQAARMSAPGVRSSPMPVTPSTSRIHRQRSRSRRSAWRQRGSRKAGRCLLEHLTIERSGSNAGSMSRARLSSKRNEATQVLWRCGGTLLRKAIYEYRVFHTTAGSRCDHEESLVRRASRPWSLNSRRATRTIRAGLTTASSYASHYRARGRSRRSLRRNLRRKSSATSGSTRRRGIDLPAISGRRGSSRPPTSSCTR